MGMASKLAAFVGRLTSDSKVPQAALAANVAGNGPAFSYWQNSGVSCSGGSYTKLTFTVSDFDTTSGMYATSRFTPTVAGYYQISAAFSMNSSGVERIIAVYKNGSQFKAAGDGSSVYQPSISCLVYFNGSTDYVEIYAYTGTTTTTNANIGSTWFQGVLVRAA